MLFSAAIEQEYDEINFHENVSKYYDEIKILIHSCNWCSTWLYFRWFEVCLHCDKLIAYSETYIGLVEVGVGLVPVVVDLKKWHLGHLINLDNDVEVNLLQEYFINIGMAKTATSGFEGLI